MGTLAVVELPYKSGLPKDKTVNTFAIAEANGHAGMDAAYLAAISGIYTTNSAALGGVPLGSYLSKGVSRVANACTVKLYDITDHLDGSPHGSPYALGTFTIATEGADLALPDEVALVCTLEAAGRSTQFVEIPDGTDPGTAVDRPRQRYTGRVYFGPFTSSATANDANGSARPTTAIMNAVRERVIAAALAIDAAGAGDVAGLGVWSRVDRAIRGIDNVRTDNAWDTQRRRGISPTAVTRQATGELVPELELGA